MKRDHRMAAEAIAMKQRAWVGEHDPEKLSPLAVRAIMADLHVHQIELEMQNEELLRAEAEMDALRALYFELFDLAPMGYCIISEKGQIQEANNTASSLLGTVRTDLVAGLFSSHVHKDDQDQWYLHRKRLLEAGASETCDLRLVKKDSTAFWARLEMVLVRDARGNARYQIAFLDISAQKCLEEERDRALRENQKLLHELQHRAKNSFFMISNMINLAAESPLSLETKTVLGGLDAKVRSISELYSLLHSTNSPIFVRLDDYCVRVATPLVGISETTLATELENVIVPASTAAPIGLILTELITNALKHAFPPGRRGTIAISLRRTARSAILELQDDGEGFPDALDPTPSPGMGLGLVKKLARQIGGVFRILGDGHGTGGTHCVLEFPAADDVAS